MPATPRILETCLYVKNVARAVKFYTELFGYNVLESQGDRFCALGVEGQQVLILFREGGTLETVHMLGGAIPPHDGSGTTHVGFSIPKEALTAWEKILEERGIAIEGRMHWPRGGTSIYFRDPDGHLLELLTPGVWKIY